MPCKPRSNAARAWALREPIRRLRTRGSDLGARDGRIRICRRATANPFRTITSRVDIPIDFPWLRQMRVRAAEYGLQAAQLRFQLARATVALDADTTYTRAIAARERLALSRRNALDADSLLRMVIRRRDAGDASDMDVELARVNAGREENVAAGDSLTLISDAARSSSDARHVGRATARFKRRIRLSRRPMRLFLGARSARRRRGCRSSRRHSTPSFSISRSGHRPAFRWDSNLGILISRDCLPTFGIGIGLPLFDRNRGPIAQAEAERVARDRRGHARPGGGTESDRARVARAGKRARSRRARPAARRRAPTRVVAMSLTAYREGASSLSNVLEAQRTARDVLAQYIDDLANAWIATAELRVLAMVPSPNPQP